MNYILIFSDSKKIQSCTKNLREVVADSADENPAIFSPIREADINYADLMAFLLGYKSFKDLRKVTSQIAKSQEATSNLDSSIDSPEVREKHFLMARRLQEYLSENHLNIEEEDAINLIDKWRPTIKNRNSLSNNTAITLPDYEPNLETSLTLLRKYRDMADSFSSDSLYDLNEILSDIKYLLIHRENLRKIDTKIFDGIANEMHLFAIFLFEKGEKPSKQQSQLAAKEIFSSLCELKDYASFVTLAKILLKHHKASYTGENSKQDKQHAVALQRSYNLLKDVENRINQNQVRFNTPDARKELYEMLYEHVTTPKLAKLHNISPSQQSVLGQKYDQLINLMRMEIKRQSTKAFTNSGVAMEGEK